MRGKWMAVLALTTMLASCGTAAPQTASPAADPAQTARPAQTAGGSAITVGGKQQPVLWDSGALTAAAWQLVLHLPG